jgi:hypothetical protein
MRVHQQGRARRADWLSGQLLSTARGRPLGALRRSHLAQFTPENPASGQLLVPAHTKVRKARKGVVRTTVHIPFDDEVPKFHPTRWSELWLWWQPACFPSQGSYLTETHLRATELMSGTSQCCLLMAGFQRYGRAPTVVGLTARHFGTDHCTALSLADAIIAGTVGTRSSNAIGLPSVSVYPCGLWQHLCVTEGGHKMYGFPLCTASGRPQYAFAGDVVDLAHPSSMILR